MSLVEFKEFVKKNPSLIKYVNNNEMTWQKFYELYDLYGESMDAWKPYLQQEEVKQTAVLTSNAAVSDFIKWLKGVNLDSIQEGINNVQRVLGVVADLGKKEEPISKDTEYKPRPLYKHFED